MHVPRRRKLSSPRVASPANTGKPQHCPQGCTDVFNGGVSSAAVAPSSPVPAPLFPPEHKANHPRAGMMGAAQAPPRDCCLLLLYLRQPRAGDPHSPRSRESGQGALGISQPRGVLQDPKSFPFRPLDIRILACSHVLLERRPGLSQDSRYPSGTGASLWCSRGSPGARRK